MPHRHPTVRSSIVSDYAPFARSRGLDPLAMVRSVGLPMRSLTQPDLLIRVGKVHRLLEQSANLSGTPDFGLQLSRTRRLSSLGALGALMRDEASVRDALRRSISSAHLNSTSIWMQLEEHGDVALLRLALDADMQTPIRQATEMALGGLLSILRHLMGPDWTPREVFFVHAPASPPARVGRFFGCPVRFSTDFNGILLDTADLDRPIPLSDQRLRQYSALAEAEPSTGKRRISVHATQQQLLALMTAGHCASSEVAATFGVHRRTLNRHLKTEGVNFSGVHDQLRLELAQQYLRAGRLEISQIATLLNFSSLSSFSRWFKRQTSLSPRNWAKS